MAVLSGLLRFWPFLLGGLYLVALWISGSTQFDRGYEQAKAELIQRYAEQRAQAAEQSLLLVQQQATRANQAETLMLQAQQQLADVRQQLQERIPHVTTVYRPALAAAPVALPRCVFTAGWVRDFNLALGAGLPANPAGGRASDAATATWPAPGTAEELLESGVTPADILAHAQDYGRWAQGIRTQLNALQALHKD